MQLQKGFYPCPSHFSSTIFSDKTSHQLLINVEEGRRRREEDVSLRSILPLGSEEMSTSGTNYASGVQSLVREIPGKLFNSCHVGRTPG